MKVFYDCTLFAFNPHKFKDNNGEDVSYNQAVFLNENEDGSREVIQLNTKLELKDSLDKKGVLELEIDSQGKQKPRILSFVPNSNQ